MSEETGCSSREGNGNLESSTGGYYDENDNDDDDRQEEMQQPVIATVRGQQNMEIDDEDTNQSTSNILPPISSFKARRHAFFQRSGKLPTFKGILYCFNCHSFHTDSTLCLGCPPPDPFTTPMQEALPLADQVTQIILLIIMFIVSRHFWH